MIHGELKAMLIFVMSMVNAIAKKMLKVKSVPHVLLVTSTFQLAQVNWLHKLNCKHKSYKMIFVISACACDTRGTVDNADTCDDSGKCDCQGNVDGDKCNTCSAGYSNFPTCTGT